MTEWAEELGRLKERHLPEIFARIDAVVASGLPRDSSLAGMLAYHLETGGKRLRAILPLMVAEALDHRGEDLVGFGAACEMIHNATLVHDDLQDGDRLRRGHDTVWVRYGAARAINLGDAMFYLANLLIEELDVDGDLRAGLMTRVSRDVLRVIDGQDREFLLKEDRSPSREDYFRMVEGKTSGLFALPIAGAAFLCGASQEVVDALERSCAHLGILFQIQDDILDLFGDKGRDRSGSDLFEGKISALVAHFLETGPEDQVSWLRGLLQTPREDVEEAHIGLALRRLREGGSLGFALGEIERRRSLALGEPALCEHPGLSRLLTQLVDIFLAPIADIN